MPEARRDENRVPAIQGVSSVDGSTPTDIHVDPETNEVLVKAGDTLPTFGNNPETVYDVSDPNSIVITQTIGADTYQQTITISGTSITEGEWIKL
jgi:hypothetical protein